jgi:hypothetical protein
MSFKKLSDLTDKQFRLNSVIGYHYQCWNEVEKKFVKSDSPQKGFSRKWQIEITDKDGKNTVDVSDDFLSKVLLDAFSKKCGIENQIIYLKTNGKTGMEIRYFPNILLVKEQPEPEITNEDINF